MGVLGLTLLLQGCGNSGSGAAPGPTAYSNVFLTDDKDGSDAKTTFTSETPVIYAKFSLNNPQSGTHLKGAWIAEKTDVAPANYKIAEKTLDIAPPLNGGDFSLSKPTKGWPIGAYRVDMYLNDKLTDTVKFSVTK